jgi:methionyl-tRNA formyltransferase
MGTPHFAVGVLEHLLESKINLVGVVTAPDKPAGRGKRMQSSAVKQYAQQHDLEILQPTHLKSVDFQEELKRLNPNLIIVVAFRMLPKQVWNYPDHGTFNLHASLLPQYRGAAPINWAIINGEKETGVTTFFIDDKIDTGNIIDSKSIKIENDDDVESLHDKLMVVGAELVVDTVRRIENAKITPQPQIENNLLKPAPKLTKDNTKINWNQSKVAIVNFVRGLTPFPTAWAELVVNQQSLKVKIYKVEANKEQHTQTPGASFYSKELKNICVAVTDGYVIIKELQMPGKKRMTSQALVNGFGWENDFYFKS